MLRTRVLRPPLGCLLAATVALAGCDSRELLAPGPTAVPRPVLSAPVGLSSATLQPPPTSSGEPGPTLSLGSVPANTWVVFEVSGQVSGTWNPACSERPPAWPCPDWPLTQVFEGAPSIYGPVIISSDYWGQVALRGTGGGSAIGLYNADRESSLSAWIRMNAVHSWDPNFGVMIPSYYKLGGGYTVTATAVPSPFRVTESAPDESGTITYTAEPLYGLQFMNPFSFGHLPPGDLVWKFFPGDSLPDTPDFSWPGWYMYDCERKLVCRFRPPVPGRMQVSAFVELRTATVRSKPEGAPVPEEPKLTLQCKGSSDSVTVERGTGIDCRAEVSPAGGGPIAWEFVADSSAYRNPANGGTPHRGTSWSGKMVLSGTITARATVEGRALEAKVHVRVTPRNWAAQAFPATAAEAAPDTGEFTTRPTRVQSLGHLHHIVTYVINRGETWEPIISGPNGLLGFFLKVPVTYHGRIHVNRLALRDSSDFWKAQPDRRPTLRPGDPIPCTRADVTPFIPVILKHEGVGFDPKSHAYLWVEQGKKEFGLAIEPIVGTSAQDLYNRAVAALDAAMTRADSAANLADTRGYAPTYCTFNYNNYPRATP